MLPLVLRLVLAAVFAVAAIAKLGDRDGARGAAADLGVPRRLAGLAAIALPAVELAVAAALLPTATARAAATAAGVLLASFTVALGAALLRGRAPACHCFGELSAEPAGPWTLARNGALLAAAAAVAAAGPGTTAATPTAVLATALAGTLAAATALGLRILRAHGRSLARVDELEAALRAAGVAVPAAAAVVPVPTGPVPGDPAPELALLQLATDRPTLLVFTDPHCGPCRDLAPDLARWHDLDDLDVVAISARPGGPDDGDALLDPQRRIFAAYGVAGTPAALVVADGHAATRVATGPDAIRTLVQQHQDAPPAPLRPGAPLGSAVLPTLDGEDLDVGQLGEEAVLIFWNPGCGHCRAMTDDLRTLEADSRVVLISSAPADALRGDRLPQEIVHDPGATIAQRVGARGTPMAVRIDAAGRIASPVAAGGTAVLALAGSHRAPVLSVVRVPA